MRSCLQTEVPLRDKSITNIRHAFVQPSRAYGYAFAISLCALVTGVLLLVPSNVRFHNYAVIYILVAITAAYLFGHGPAIAACSLGMYAYLHFFVPQLESPGPSHGFQVWSDVVTFLLAIAIATICALTARRFTLETTKVLEDLSKSHARVTEIVESIGDPFFVLDENRQYSFVNQAAERHFERPRRELLNQCICSLYPDEFGTFFHKACLEAVDKKTSIQFETAISRLNRWVEVRVSPISSGVAVHIHDITKRKHTEEEIQKQRNRANEYLNVANVIMLVLDLEGRVQMINRKGSEILGYAKEDVTGKEWFANFLPIESRDKVRQMFEGLIAGKNEEFEYLESSIVTKSGQKRLIAWRNTVLSDDHGKIYAVLSSGEDITERRKMEEMLRVTERHKLEFYRKMVLAATDYKLELVDNGEIEEMVGTPLATWQIGDSQTIGVIRHCVQEAAEVAGMDPDKIEQFITCIGEAATNAWKHAGGGSASMHCRHDSLVFVIKDNGPGIDPLNLPNVALRVGYSTARTLGAGYKVMINLADKVYLATGVDGTTVAVEMKLSKQDTTPFPLCVLEDEEVPTPDHPSVLSEKHDREAQNNMTDPGAL